MDSPKSWLTTPIKLTLPNGPSFTLAFGVVWSILTAPSATSILAIAGIGAQVTYRALQGIDQSTEVIIPKSIRSHYEAFILATYEELKNRFPNEESLLIDFSYNMLRQREATRADMAHFASFMLGETIGTEAWRKRVDRWAERQGLPKVEQYKRKSNELA